MTNTRAWLLLVFAPCAVAVSLATGMLGWFAIAGTAGVAIMVARSMLVRSFLSATGPRQADYHRIRDLERDFGMELTPLPKGARARGAPGYSDYYANVRAVATDTAPEGVSLHPPLTEAQLNADAVDYWSRVPPTSEEIDANVRRIDAKVRRLASEERTR